MQLSLLPSSPSPSSSFLSFTFPADLSLLIWRWCEKFHAFLKTYLTTLKIKNPGLDWIGAWKWHPCLSSSYFCTQRSVLLTLSHATEQGSILFILIWHSGLEIILKVLLLEGRVVSDQENGSWEEAHDLEVLASITETYFKRDSCLADFENEEGATQWRNMSNSTKNKNFFTNWNKVWVFPLYRNIFGGFDRKTVSSRGSSCPNT